MKVDLGEELLDRFRTHPGGEIITVLLLSFAILAFIQELSLSQRGVTRIDDNVVLVVDHALELTRTHVEHETEARRHALVEPDVRDRHCQLDVAHAFAANARERYFNAATVADNALVLDALVFSAGAFPVASRT